MILGFVHQVQLSVFVKAIGMGYFFGIIFSIFMFFNAICGKNAFVVFLRDVTFFVISAILTFMFALKYNSGMLRFYIPAGELMGFIIFYIFPGMYMGKCWRKIADILEIKFSGKTEKLKNTFCRLNHLFDKNVRLHKEKKVKCTHNKKLKKNIFRGQKKINKKYERFLKKITKNT